jgi:uncharacterized protein YkwD
MTACTFASGMRTSFVLVLMTMAACFSTGSAGWCQLAADQVAPAFALRDVDGRRHELAEAQDADLVILYFCDLNSASNRKGLMSVNGLLKTRNGLNVKAFAITPSSAEIAKEFMKESPISIPLLLDDSGIVELYHSHLILPSVYILKNGQTVSKVVLGGGRSMEILIAKSLEQAKSTRDNRPDTPPASRKPSTLRETKETTRDNQESNGTTSLPPYPIRKSVEKPEDKARKLFHLAREENPKLTWDDCLASKAVQRAQSLQAKGVIEHKDPTTGKNPAFDMVKACAQRAAYAGENLSRTMGSGSRAIHQEFMDSSTHRQNIQNGKYSKMGVGCYETICVELFVGF